MSIHKINYQGSAKIITSIVTAVNSLIDSVKTSVPEGAVFTDTTYKLTLEGNELVMEDSSGNKQTVTLPSSTNIS